MWHKGLGDSTVPVLVPKKGTITGTVLEGIVPVLAPETGTVLGAIVPVLASQTGTVLRGKLGGLKNMNFVEEVLFFGRK